MTQTTRPRMLFSPRTILISMIAFVFAIGLAPVLASAADDPVGGRPFTVPLTGGATEVPNPGDPNGSGTAELTLNQGKGEVCFKITVSDITLPASLAHIHKAPAGVAGPIVVTLVPPAATGKSSGCVAATPDLIKDIRQNPDQYYVNVHTSDFQGGAVRGQLSK